MYLIYYENNDDLFHYKLTNAVTVSVTSTRKYENLEAKGFIYVDTERSQEVKQIPQ